MHEEMSMNTSRGFLWRTLVSCLLIFDYFLFTTGNPSITYSILGGWFWLTLITVVMVVTSCVPASFKGGETKPFYVLLGVVGGLSSVLIIASPYAREFAVTSLQAEIDLFVKNTINSKADASKAERQLMVKVKSQKYVMDREAFIPTSRRMDYIFRTDAGEKYRLIMVISWNGTPIISLRRVDT